jgi:hypothetical protein
MTLSLTNSISLVIAFFIFCLTNIDAQDRPYIELYSGMQINGDVLLAKGDYVVNPDKWIPIVIEGQNIDVNFNDLLLFGDFDDTEPNNYKNTAIIIRNAKNVKIRNLRIRRFKTAVIIENSQDITIDNCNISYMYRPWKPQHLYSYSKSIINLEPKSVEIQHSTNIKIQNSYFNVNHNSIHLGQSKFIKLSGNIFLFNSGIPITAHNSQSITISANKFEFNFTPNYSQDTLNANILLINIKDSVAIFSNSFYHAGAGISVHSDVLNDSIYVRNNDFNWIYNHALHVQNTNLIALNNRFSNTKTGIHVKSMGGLVIKENQFKVVKTVLNVTNLRKRNKSIIFNANNASGFELLTKSTKRLNPKNISIEMNCLSFDSVKEHSFEHFSTKKFRSNIILLKDYKQLGKCIKRRNSVFGLEDSVMYITPCASTRTKSDSIDITFDLPDTRYFLYPFQGFKNMVYSAYGPSDYRQPAIHIDTEQGQITLSGPAGNAFRLQADRLIKIEKQTGIFSDTVKISNSEAKKFTWPLTMHYTGHYFINDRGTFIPDNDTFSTTQWSTYLLPDSTKLSCYKIGDPQKLKEWTIKESNDLKKIMRSMPESSSEYTCVYRTIIHIPNKAASLRFVTVNKGDLFLDDMGFHIQNSKEYLQQNIIVPLIFEGEYLKLAWHFNLDSEIINFGFQIVP